MGEVKENKRGDRVSCEDCCINLSSISLLLDGIASVFGHNACPVIESLQRGRKCAKEARASGLLEKFPVFILFSVFILGIELGKINPTNA